MKNLLICIVVLLAFISCKYTHSKSEEHVLSIHGYEVILKSEIIDNNGQKYAQKSIYFNGKDILLSKQNTSFRGDDVFIDITPSMGIILDNKSGFFDEFKWFKEDK